MRFDTTWEQTGPADAPWARLTAREKLTIAIGVPMHVEAYAVMGDTAEPAHEFVSDEVAALYSIYDQAMRRAYIDGREYLICAFPHGV